MFFAAEPYRGHCDLELLVPYLAAMTSSAKSGSIGQRCSSAAAASAPAAAAAAPACFRPAPVKQQATKEHQRKNPFEGEAPPSPPPAAPARPPKETEKIKKNAPEASSPSSAPSPSPSSSPSLGLHHFRCPSSGAHVFSLDLPGRSLSSFEISVEEREGTGRLFIDAAAIDGVTEKQSGLPSSFVVPRRALALSLDLPRDADLSKVSADYEAGVLLITVPLMEKEVPRRFKVMVGGGGGGKAKKEEEKMDNEEEDKASPPPPSSPSSSLGAVAAADLARASLAAKNDDANDEDEEEDGSWKAVSDDEEEGEGEEEEEEEEDGVSRPSSSSATSKKNKNKSKKLPSGGAVLEAIEDDN